jgi:hypothetical protein
VADKTTRLIGEVSTTSTHLTTASSNLITLLNEYKIRKTVLSRQSAP